MGTQKKKNHNKTNDEENSKEDGDGFVMCRAMKEMDNNQRLNSIGQIQGMKR